MEAMRFAETSSSPSGTAHHATVDVQAQVLRWNLTTMRHSHNEVLWERWNYFVKKK